jgi:sugar/nucleoside kinase (ribokinase family)
MDPTGAGDSFAGGFMGHVAASDSIEASTLRQAMLYGTATASRCVEGFSTEQLETRSMVEIERRREELVQMITP